MKDKLGPYHFDDIMRMMLDIFPGMELGEDNDGQLIVYTGFECASSDGFYAPMKAYYSFDLLCGYYDKPEKEDKEN